MNAAPGHAIHLCRVWGSRHGGSLYSRTLVEELHGLGWQVTVVSEQFLSSAGAASELELPALFSRAAGPFARLRATIRLFQIATRDPGTLVIVQGDIPRLSYVLLQFWVPLIFIRQDGILTCPGNDRFLHSSHSVCTRSPSPLCFLVDRKEHCLREGGFIAHAGRLGFRLRDLLLLKSLRHFVTVSHYLQTRHHKRAQVLYPPLLTHRFAARGGADCCAENHLMAGLEKANGDKTQATTISPAKMWCRNLNTLVFCGRLETSKGPSDALRILGSLPEYYRLVILGDGSELERLSMVVAALPFGSRVELKGWVGAAVRDQILRSAGALLLPSLCDEGFGMAGLEAFAQGTPVVAYNVGGIPEWCRYPAGILVRPGDIHAAAKAVRGLTESSSRWRVHSLAARRMVEHEFPPERFKIDLQRMLARICSPVPGHWMGDYCES
jgi:glycosyltransferase involved in cell wall biosynthesis